MKTTSHRNQQEIESFQDFFTYQPETYNRDYNTDRCTTNSIYSNDGFKNIVNHCGFSVKSSICGEGDGFEDEDGCFIGDGNGYSSDEGYHDQYSGDENVSLQRNSSTCRRTGHNNDINAMGSDNDLEHSIILSRRKNSGISVTEDFKTAEVFVRHDHDQGSFDDYDHGEIIDDGADFDDYYSHSGRRHQFVCHGEGHIYRYDYLEEDVPQDPPKFHHQKPSRQGFSSEENEEACNSVFEDDGCQVTDIRDGYCGSFAIDDRNESQNEVIENLELGEYDAHFDEVKDCADVNCQDDRLPLRLIGVPELHRMDDYAEDDRQNLAHRRSPPCENTVDSTACEDYSSLSDEGEFAPTNHTATRDDKQTDGQMSHRQHSDRTIQPIQNNRNIQAAKFLYSPLDVIQRIELVMASLIDYLDQNKAPILKSFVETRSDIIRANDSNDSDSELGSRACNRNINLRKNNVNSNPTFQRSFGNISQTRSFTSVVLVMSFVHQLLLSNRTTTTREVYYVFVTHFRSQRECDSAILDVAKILDVPRRALGLSASPKGWFCGCVEITRKGTLPSGKDISGSVDGTAISSMQGLPITREWIERDDHGKADGGIEIHVSSKNVKCILVIEKEGVYNRLSEERLFDRFPCILVTGKGFPDLATRALVHTLYNELKIPVLGLCDGNPYGISVLALYHCAGDRMGVDGGMKYGVPIKWLGLRHSHVAELEEELPKTVFQKLSDLDYKRIDTLLEETNPFLDCENRYERQDEIIDLKESGYKIELEALYWMGPDYMSNWIYDMLVQVDEEGEHQKVAI